MGDLISVQYVAFYFTNHHIEKNSLRRVMSKLGQLLLEKRIKKNISQKKLAKQMGWKSGQYVSNYERSKSPVPIDKALFNLLGVSIREGVAAYLKDCEDYFKEKMG